MQAIQDGAMGNLSTMCGKFNRLLSIVHLLNCMRMFNVQSNWFVYASIHDIISSFIYVNYVFDYDCILCVLYIYNELS